MTGLKANFIYMLFTYLRCMKSRIFYSLLAFIIATLCFQSFIIEEQYHFSKKKNGHYIMSFDLGKFAEKDSTGEILKGVIGGMTEELSKVDLVPSITYIESTVNENTVSVSYDFMHRKIAVKEWGVAPSLKLKDT
jgi:hypothetical protein